MLSKTFAAAALVATAAAYSASDLPACWSDCFAKYQADQECLCSESIGKVVSHCIAKGCDSASNEAYVEWLSGYCVESVPTTASNTWTAVETTPPPAPETPTDAYPAPTTPPAPESPPTYPTDGTAPPAPEGTAPPSYPSVASPPPPYPYGTPTGTVCVETSTLIWRSSTSVTTYSVTATGGWEYPAGAPSGTGAWPAGGTAPPVPYTGGAVSSFKAAGAAGLAIFVGAAALLL